MEFNIKPEIKNIKLSSIKPCPTNPREINDTALEGLKESIKNFGYLDLLVINKKNMQIVSGHQRFKILKGAGVKTAPCIIVNLDRVRQQSLMVTMNNQQIAGYWTAALIPILEKLKENNPDEFLKLRLAELREDVKDFEIENKGSGKTLPDDIPETPKKATTKPGDLWLLGDHRLLCGSSLIKKDVFKLMRSERAGLLATDPPYLVDYTGKDRPNGGRDWSDVFREIDIKKPKEFLTGFLKTGLEYCLDRIPIYVWHASSRIMLLTEVFNDLNLLIHQQIIWVKPCSVFSFSIYPWRHEPCLFGWKKGSKPLLRTPHRPDGTVWMIGLTRSGDPEQPEYYTDIWELDWEGKKSPGKNYHPTIKPTEVFAVPMRVHTKPGDVCYEPFSGFGSQIIAAERLNRRCFAMEVEPVFVDVAVRRWEEFSGGKAQLKRK